MKKNRWLRYAALVTVILTAVIVFLPKTEISAARSSADIQKEIDKLESTLKSNNGKLKDIEKSLSNTKYSLNQTLNNKVYIESKMELCEQNISDTEKLISNYELLIRYTEEEIAKKEGRIDDEYDQFKNWLRVSYEYGTVNYIEMFLSSESLTDFLLNAELIGNMMKYESKNLDKLDAALAELNVDYESLKAYKQTLDEKKEGLDEQRAEYSAMLSEYDASIRTLQANQTKFQSQYEAAKAAEDELDKKLTKLLAELAAAKTSEYAGGQFIWPVDLKWSRISSPFGNRDLWGKPDFHRGIDIPAAAGSNIYASNSGTVVTAASHSSYGNYIVIDHGGGYSTLYAHCSKLIAKTGDKVKQGDVIALVGTTGNSSGNHCHFEVRINGVIKQPLDYVVQP